MNTLGYAILSALSIKPCSGYDLAAYLEAVWPAQHSQIYPMLTKMEQKELLVYELIEQIGKPNKKVFSITDKGKEILKQWTATSPSESIIRDEFLIKMYSIWLSNEENAINLVEDRISDLQEKMGSLSKKIEKIEQEKELDSMSRNFGRYVLYNRKYRLAEEEKSWCQWVLDLIKKTKLNIPLLCCFGTGKFNIIMEKLLIIG